MVSVISIIFCGLLLAESILCQTDCLVKKYSLSVPVKCSVSEEIKVNFAIKETPSTCKETETICVKFENIGSTLKFTGTFKDNIRTVFVAAAGKSATLPILHLTDDKQFLANPMAAVFNGAISVPENKALKFELPIKTNLAVTAHTDIVEDKTSAKCDVNAKLCYTLNANVLLLWGLRGGVESVTIKGTDGTVVLPLITIAANEDIASPLLLVVPKGNVLKSPQNVEIPFIATTVTSQPAGLLKNSNCAETDACYELVKAPNKATFSGIMPAGPLTIKINGTDENEYITFLFGNVGNKLESDAVALLITIAVFYVSRT